VSGISAPSPSKRLSIGLTIRCSIITTYCNDRSYKYPENALTNQLTNRSGKQLKEVQSMPRDDGGQKTEDGEQEIRITGEFRI
jgi:hypothetical protein